MITELLNSVQGTKLYYDLVTGDSKYQLDKLATSIERKLGAGR